MEKINGVVKWFDAAKGFGFIQLEDKDEQIFVHYSQIKTDGFKTLEKEQPVQFEVKLNEDTQKNQAYDVEIIK